MRLVMIMVAIVIATATVIPTAFAIQEAFNEERSRERCEAVQDSGCDKAVEKEREIAAAGGEWIDDEWFEYDPDTYWLPEEE